MLTIVGIISLAALFCGVAGTEAAPFEMSPANCEVLQRKFDMPTACAMAFDRENRPYLYDQHSTAISTWRDGKWVQLDFSGALRRAKIKFTPERDPEVYAMLTVDDSGAIYLLIPKPYRANGSYNNAVLLYRPAEGEDFMAYPMPIPTTAVVMESRAGGNVNNRPPAIVTSLFTRQLEGKGDFRWARLNTMHLILPEKTADGLSLGAPIELSRESFGLTAHSGGNNVAVTDGDLTHVAYVRKPDNLTTGGNPTRVITVDRRKRAVVSDTFVMNAEPAWADIHSNPGMVMDYRKRLQLMTGAHYGGNFLHRSAAQANSAAAWGEQLVVGKDQSYVALTADSKNTLHLAPRNGNRLEYQQKTPDGKWSAPQLLAHRANYRGYATYYHHLFIDRKDNLYLTFSYNDKNTKKRPKLIAVSSDGGRSWRLCSTEFCRSQIGEQKDVR